MLQNTLDTSDARLDVGLVSHNVCLRPSPIPLRTSPLFSMRRLVYGVWGSQPGVDPGGVLAWPRVVTSPPPTGRRCSTGRAAHRGPTAKVVDVRPSLNRNWGSI